MQCSSRMLHRRKGRKGLCIRPVRCRGTACLWACNVTVLHTCACAAAAAWPLQDRGAHEAAAAVRRSRPKRVGVPVRLGDDGLRADCLAVHRRNRRRRNQLAHACAPPVREVSGRARSAASPDDIVPVGAIDPIGPIGVCDVIQEVQPSDPGAEGRSARARPLLQALSARASLCRRRQSARACHSSPARRTNTPHQLARARLRARARVALLMGTN